jgi:hypothetical protein
MFYPKDPNAMRDEHENRVAAARRARPMSQLESDLLDFTDYNRQRYAAISAARARREAPPVPAPRRPVRGIVRKWATTLRTWLL